MYFEKGKRCKLLFVLLVGLSAPAAYSANPPVNHSHTPTWFSNFASLFASSYVVTLSGFQGWQTSNTKQTLFLTPDIEKSYVSNPSNQAFGVGELFVGIQQDLNKRLQGQIGLALLGTGSTRLSGNIWDDADPEFNNYSYTYFVSHTHLAVKGKLLVDMGMDLIPWVSGSVGVGFNQAYQYSSTPLLYQALPTPGFSSNTTIAFTYTVGLGIQYPVTDNWEVGLGYEFADWGQSQLGRASGQTVGSGLVLDHLYTSSVLLNLTYLA